MNTNKLDDFLPENELLEEGVVIVNQSREIIFTNTALDYLLGYEANELIGKTLEILLPQRFQKPHAQLVKNFQNATTTPMPMGDRPILPAMRQDGSETNVSVSIINIQLDSKYSIAIVNSLESGNRRVSFYKKIAEKDLLTGLGNRLALSLCLQHYIKDKQAFSILFLDLDKFKPINDNHGHQKGDIVLNKIAQRINNSLRTSDCVTRIGGDEFVVVLHNLVDRGQIEQIANKIHKKIKEPIREGKADLSVGASIGAAIYPNDAETEQDLINIADKAMYHAKTKKLKFYMN